MKIECFEENARSKNLDGKVLSTKDKEDSLVSSSHLAEYPFLYS